MMGELFLVESEAERLKTLAAERDPFETGGILLGVLSDNVPWVTRAIEVPPSRPKRSRYELPAGATHGLLADARLRDPRLGYIGDWHSHPADTGLSTADLRSLARMARQAALSGEPPPILLLVRKTGTDWRITASGPGRPFARTMPVVLTGTPARWAAPAEDGESGC